MSDSNTIATGPHRALYRSISDTAAYLPGRVMADLLDAADGMVYERDALRRAVIVAMHYLDEREAMNVRAELGKHDPTWRP